MGLFKKALKEKKNPIIGFKIPVKEDRIIASEPTFTVSKTYEQTVAKLKELSIDELS